MAGINRVETPANSFLEEPVVKTNNKMRSSANPNSGSTTTPSLVVQPATGEKPVTDTEPSPEKTPD